MNVQFVTKKVRKMKVKNRIIATILFITFSGMIGINQTKENEVKKEIVNIQELIEENENENRIELYDGGQGSQVVFIEKFGVSQNDAEIVEETEEVKVGGELLLQFPQLSNEDIYYLKKIAYCEAGSVGIQTMSLVMLVVLNRVQSPDFPNSVYEVIMEPGQFSVCKPGGTWYYLEPDERTDEAFNMIWNALYDYSDGALYFENCKNANNWHSRNLEYLYSSDGVRFYK